MRATFEQLRTRQPQLFSGASLTLPMATRDALVALIEAIESVIALPAYQAQAIAQAPEVASHTCAARGVFMGYDFHLTDQGPKLIEINTNAGGGLLNAYLLAGRGRETEATAVVETLVAMFREEWRLVRGAAPLNRIAIVDENPASQFLAPEFEQFKAVFEAHGIAAVIADPAELTGEGGRLFWQGHPVDLVYNRLTDFAFADPRHAHLRDAWLSDGAVITPHPRAHALYADKRNLMLLSNGEALETLGVDATARQILQLGIPQTIAVDSGDADALWAGRKRWFFKPPAGFGSRAAYRGDKLTRRVFDEILQGDYIAQEIAPPSEHPVPVAGEDGPQTVTMKADFRCYVYDGRLQLVAARLYQGQTTNFRTPGGGFAPVFFE